MNEVIQALLNRRNCRAFTQDAVSESDVQTILKCALAAPSAMGRELWKFTAVMDRAKIQKLAKAVGKALDRGQDYNMYDPAVLIITSNDTETPFRREDNACAMENIYLASEALGLGCVWINQLLTVADDAGVRAVLSELHVPENHGVYGCAAIGYPAKPYRREKAPKGQSEIIA